MKNIKEYIFEAQKTWQTEIIDIAKQYIIEPNNGEYDISDITNNLIQPLNVLHYPIIEVDDKELLRVKNGNNCVTFISLETMNGANCNIHLFGNVFSLLQQAINELCFGFIRAYYSY